jgi:hypothetical protein
VNRIAGFMPNKNEDTRWHRFWCRVGFHLRFPGYVNFAGTIVPDHCYYCGKVL